MAAPPSSWTTRSEHQQHSRYVWQQQQQQQGWRTRLCEPSSGTRGRRPASQRVRAELGDLCSARRLFIYRDDELLGVLTD